MATQAAEATPAAQGRRARRVVLAVGLAAAAVAAAVVGVTLLQTRGETTTIPGAVGKPQAGQPPLELELGLRSGAEARALARAEVLYDQKHRVAQAAAIFRRYRSVEAQLGVLFAGWRGPSSLGAVKRLAATHPNDAAVLLNLGWADYWAGRNADAVSAWQKTAARFPNSPYGVDAEDALHGSTPRGLPPILTGLSLPKTIAKLPAARQIVALRRAAEKPDARAKLLYGVALWNLRRPVSAEREFAAAAKLAPHDALARTAAAVGLFSKSNPARAFGKLGPLTAVFPHSPVVEFHLGVLLLYIDERTKAAKQLNAAVADGPQSIYAKPATTLLASLGQTGSK